MLENIPSESIMTELLGQSLFETWQKLCTAIDEKYEMKLDRGFSCFLKYKRSCVIKDMNSKKIFINVADTFC